MRSKGIYLFPYKTRAAGYLLVVTGLIFVIIRFYYGIKLSFLDIKILALYSSYLDSKYFTIVQNNFGEEIPALLLYSGLLFLGFSREKKEEEVYMNLRLKSFIWSFYFNVLLSLFITLFFFGFGYIQALIVSSFSFLLAYIITFRLILFNYRKKARQA